MLADRGSSDRAPDGATVLPKVVSEHIQCSVSIAYWDPINREPQAEKVEIMGWGTLGTVHLSAGAPRPVRPLCNTSSHPPSSVPPLHVMCSLERSRSSGVGCCVLADVEKESLRVYVVTRLC